MRLGLEGEIEVIVGDGSSDWKRIENALRRHERDYCKGSVFFPKRGKEGKARAQGMAITLSVTVIPSLEVEGAF